MRGWPAAVAVVLAGSALAAADPELDLAEHDGIDLPFDRSQLSLTVRGTSPSTLDSGGSYRDSSVAVGGAVSLYSRLHVSSSELSMVRVLAQFRLEDERVQADVLGGDRQIGKGSLGATAIYLSPGRNLYMLYAGVALAQGGGTFDHLSPMPTVMGLGTASTGKTRWIYGGGIGYLFGRAWVLPAAGVLWPISNDWTLAVLLPAFADLRHAFSTTVSGDVMLAASGDQFDFANDGVFAGAADHLQLRLAQLRLSVGTTYRWSPSWSVRGELGVVVPRHLEILDGDTTVASGQTPGAGYVAATLRYAFGSSPTRWGADRDSALP